MAKRNVLIAGVVFGAMALIVVAVALIMYGGTDEDEPRGSEPPAVTAEQPAAAEPQAGDAQTGETGDDPGVEGGSDPSQDEAQPSTPAASGGSAEVAAEEYARTTLGIPFGNGEPLVTFSEQDPDYAIVTTTNPGDDFPAIWVRRTDDGGFVAVDGTTRAQETDAAEVPQDISRPYSE